MEPFHGRKMATSLRHATIYISKIQPNNQPHPLIQWGGWRDNKRGTHILINYLKDNHIYFLENLCKLSYDEHSDI